MLSRTLNFGIEEGVVRGVWRIQEGWTEKKI